MNIKHTWTDFHRFILRSRIKNPFSSVQPVSSVFHFSFQTDFNGILMRLPWNYLRIWEKEDGSNWKIVLDLVNIAR